MGVISYQIGIFFAIQIAAFFGKSARNIAIALICIFTVAKIFTSWLMILQFVTVFISYLVSQEILGDKQQKPISRMSKEDKSELNADDYFMRSSFVNTRINDRANNNPYEYIRQITKQEQKTNVELIEQMNQWLAQNPYSDIGMNQKSTMIDYIIMLEDKESAVMQLHKSIVSDANGSYHAFKQRMAAKKGAAAHAKVKQE